MGGGGGGGGEGLLDEPTASTFNSEIGEIEIFFWKAQHLYFCFVGRLSFVFHDLRKPAAYKRVPYP